MSPRIRTIKVEFWTDDKVVRVSLPARLLILGMLNYADDHGVLEDSPLQLKMRLFPADSEIDVKKIENMLQELSSVGLILRWHKGTKAYIHIRNFNKHQVINRPSFSSLPKPPDFTDHIKAHGVLSEEAMRETETETEGKRKKNIVTSNEVTRDILPDVTPPDLKDEAQVKAEFLERKAVAKAKDNFEVWWKAFPSRRKVGKPKCYQKWLQLRRDKKLLPLEQMLTVLERQKRSKDWLKDGGDFIPGPHPYLNQLIFMDESLDSGSGLAPRPVFTPAPPQLTPENVHEYADPECPECQGKGMFLKEVKGIKVRVRCECADKKFNKMTGEKV